MSIDEKFQSALNKQVTAEHQAALIYTQLAYELDRLSFSGMSHWMAAQAAEERVHAQKFADHLLARDARVDVENIDMPSIKVSNPLDAFEMALEHEKKVSALIRNLVSVAEEVGDIDSRSLLNEFLSEQIEEEDTVGEIIDRLKLAGAEGSGQLRIDAELASR